MTTPKNFHARFGGSRATIIPPRAQRALNILLLEPDPDEARRLAHMLPSQHAVHVVTTMSAALQILHTQSPHLILTELDLPDGSGLDFIARIHQTPAWRHVLLMVLTNRSTLRDKIAAFEAGADEYLTKPVDAAYLGEHVRRLSLFVQVIRG